MKNNRTKRQIYIRIFSAFFAIYLLLMAGFSIFLLSKEKKVAGMELQAFALQVNNGVEEALKEHIDSNNQIADIVKVKKELIKRASLFNLSGTEMAVFTGDYKLFFNTNDYWLCSYTEYKEGSKHYVGYGYLNPREWFAEKEIAEIENYLNADPKPKKEGDLSGYAVHLKGFWVDGEMIIPDIITVNPMYAHTFDEMGNVESSGGTHTDDLIYISGFENTEDLPYFQHGNIQAKAYGNYNSEKQAVLRQMVIDRGRLMEAIKQIGPSWEGSERINFLTYRYYLPLPYQNRIRVLDDQNYFSDFWTVIARDINMWERCSAVLLYVWFSCLITFIIVASILSKQTYKIYQEREEFEKQRREMTRALAHDLKTPLSIISGYAQNLQENIHMGKREHYASHIQANVGRMDKLVGDMLEMTRLESDSFRVMFEDVSLSEVGEKIISRYRQICQEKFIIPQLEGEAVIRADAALLERVLDNFFVNALSNTPEAGTIRMRITVDTFEFFNSGSHIPEEKIKGIWEPYNKAEASRSNTKGTGLGLSIARTILELHKFPYGVKNSSDGVIFWFKFA